MIKPLYESESELYEKNAGQPSADLLEHLRRYDRFFSEDLHQPSWLTRSTFIGKLVTAAVSTTKKRRLLGNLWMPNSEAMRVARQIVLQMSQEVRVDGADFALVFLPTHSDLRELRRHHAFAARWRVMVSWLCGEELRCLDLSEDLVSVAPDTLDRGYDGTHHGPRTNRLIGEFLARRLEGASLDLGAARGL